MWKTVTKAAIYLLLPFLFICTNKAVAQIDYTANTKVIPYNGYFLYGSNMAYKNNNWKDEDIADILVGNTTKSIEGVGVNSLRPALYENFVEKYGYDIRLDAFQHYTDIGTLNNVIFIGDRPSDAHREKKQYVSDLPSESYENLYEPIWDNGENGTPVNDKNYYALYVYKVAKMYGANVKFWEIKNEPDFTYDGCGNRTPGEDCNWWDNDPSPASLKNLRAPVQSYIRMLRVSYEVIKYVDPEAYVCIGGIGYASFLDAVLRNTDNPDGGKVTSQYPLKGGAWFDCLSFHVYPMYYLREWVGTGTPGNVNGFRYFRHSDGATEIAMQHKNKLVEVLAKYGYGTTYPEKEVIITETNIPHKAIGDHIGSQEAQRNYLIKSAIISQKNKIRAVYPFCPWDTKEINDDSGTAYDYEGFYKPIPEAPGGTLRLNQSGIGWRTMSSLLFGRMYDETETQKLSLPPGVDGGAFYSLTDENYIYVLWAKTTTDQSEEATASYSFPTEMNVKSLSYISWDNSKTNNNGNSLTLTGAPVFIKTGNNTNNPEPEPEPKYPPLHINTFTPNGDGVNDVFLGEDFRDKIILLKIFTRTGRCIYTGTTGWDGMYENKLVAAGTYFFIVYLKHGDGTQTLHKGSVTLLQ